MIGLSTLAARFLMLRLVVVSVFVALHPGAMDRPDAPKIADAIAAAVAMDPEPVFGDSKLEAAAAARWAWEESRLSTHPTPFSWDAKAGLACGYMQLRCVAMPHTLLGQAQAWLVLAHRGAAWCPQSPLAPLSGACGGKARRLADARVREVRAMLAEMNAE